MKRLSLAELKAQSGNVVENLEAINGGNAGGCHCQSYGATPGEVLSWIGSKLMEPIRFFAEVYNATHEYKY